MCAAVVTASCYNCCAHPGSNRTFVLVSLTEKSVHISHAEKTLYAAVTSKKNDVTAKCFLHSQSLTVSVGVLKLDYICLIFVNPRAKINEICYSDLLMSQKLLPAVYQFSGEFVFQQDGSPMYTGTLVF